MKLKKIQRPEIEIEYVGIKGFFDALRGICKVGLIRKINVELVYNIDVVKRIRPIKRHYIYAIPKYRLKRVSKLSESEVQGE